jgi:phage/plasmid-like protein (TIGR03299 family)
MAYVGSTPWHRLGQRLQAGASIGEWIAAAGLDWEALMVPGFMQIGADLVRVPDHFHLVRSDTLAPLGAFSGQYKPVQPAQVLEFFRDYVTVDDRFTLETAGSLKDGAVIWALAKFNGDLEAGGDQHSAYVQLATSMDGSMATTAQGTFVRTVCNNTLTAGMRDKRAVVKVRHSREFKGVVQAQAAKDLAEIAQQVQAYKAMGDALSRVQMSAQDVADFFRAVLDIPQGSDRKDVSARKANQFDELVASLNATYREGTAKNTKWAALNAVTRYADHARSTRNAGGNEAAGRLYSANFGSGAALKSKALELLAA